MLVTVLAIAVIIVSSDSRYCLLFHWNQNTHAFLHFRRRDVCSCTLLSMLLKTTWARFYQISIVHTILNFFFFIKKPLCSRFNLYIRNNEAFAWSLTPFKHQIFFWLIVLHYFRIQPYVNIVVPHERVLQWFRYQWILICYSLFNSVRLD